MKKIHLLTILFLAFLLNSCEEVVHVDLNTEKPRLVIDANINWYKGTDGFQQKIKLSTTTDFYTNEIPAVSGATIFIKNSANTVFDFLESPIAGEYVCTNFIPQVNETYTLTVISGGQTYTATETLKSLAPITDVIQNNEGGFNGHSIEIKALYTDPAGEDNFYLYKYQYADKAKPDYYADEDKFFQGNPFFSISQNFDIKTGDVVAITHYGITKGYFNYMNILLSIAGSNGGGPFQSPPATLKGNIVNTTDFDNYALGYFRLGEADTRAYTVL
jgi:hypothetical protein